MCRAQSDEGCRRNLFNISRKKGVGYLRVVIAVSSQKLLQMQTEELLKYNGNVCNSRKKHTVCDTSMLNQTPLGQITWRKSSVDAHGLSSHLGCSRTLWHLISFLNHQRTPTVLAEKANRQMTTQLRRRTNKQIEHTRSIVWDACPIQLNKWLQANLTWSVVRTSRAQSDEGCRRNLFNISRKKGVGYLRVVIAVSSQKLLQMQTEELLKYNGSVCNSRKKHTVCDTSMLNQTPLGQITWRKSSVDAHGLSSHLGCSRTLWHLISFLNHQRTPTVLAEKANRQMTTQLRRRTNKQIEHLVPLSEMHVLFNSTNDCKPI